MFSISLPLCTKGYYKQQTYETLAGFTMRIFFFLWGCVSVYFMVSFLWGPIGEISLWSKINMLLLSSWFAFALWVLWITNFIVISSLYWFLESLEPNVWPTFSGDCECILYTLLLAPSSLLYLALLHFSTQFYFILLYSMCLCSIPQMFSETVLACK